MLSRTPLVFITLLAALPGDAARDLNLIERRADQLLDISRQIEANATQSVQLNHPLALEPLTTDLATLRRLSEQLDRQISSLEKNLDAAAPQEETPLGGDDRVHIGPSTP